ncbi:MAG: hypothetical protein EBZ44_01790 [Verrucomicrobia bacterium]|nr:hypothetical protein [Verrucomicrobiota bacterium]
MAAAVCLTNPRRLPETVRTLRRLGIRVSSEGAVMIASSSASLSSRFSGKAGRSGMVLPLLVPDSKSPARTLALLKKLAAKSAGPFFAAGKAGQINAALFAAACLANREPKILRALDLFRSRQTSAVPQSP